MLISFQTVPIVNKLSFGKLLACFHDRDEQREIVKIQYPVSTQIDEEVTTLLKPPRQKSGLRGAPLTTCVRVSSLLSVIRISQ
jgi:hypothetical protein